MTAPAQRVINVAAIAGWGVDADPQNDPTYPMRDITADDKGGMNWQRPSLQQPLVEILHSNERPGLSAAFGTSSPPSGLSGMIRRSAFKKSEAKWGHWLLLLMADRINVIEGLLSDVFHLRFPHILREMGIRAEWRYNKPGFFRKLAYTLLAIVVVVGLIALLVKAIG